MPLITSQRLYLATFLKNLIEFRAGVAKRTIHPRGAFHFVLSDFKGSHLDLSRSYPGWIRLGFLVRSFLVWASRYLGSASTLQHGLPRPLFLNIKLLGNFGSNLVKFVTYLNLILLLLLCSRVFKHRLSDQSFWALQVITLQPFRILLTFQLFLTFLLEVKLETGFLHWLHESIEIITWLSKNVSNPIVAEEIYRLITVLSVLLLWKRIQTTIHLLLKAVILLLLASSIDEIELIVLLIQVLVVLALDIEVLIWKICLFLFKLRVGR